MTIQKTWNVKFYQSSRGDYPIISFIERLDIDTKGKIGKSINLLINGGPFLKPPQIKKLQKNLYELRIKGKDLYRIFYTLKNGVFYLLHIFKKKSQKIPTKELKTAIDRMKEII